MAFFSNQGAPIYSGAAGTGPLRAFRDGSLGVMATMYDGGARARGGRRSAWKPYRPKKKFTSRRSISTLYSPPSRPRRIAGTGVAYEGPMMAYRDGSLGGAGYGPSQAFRDGSLGESGSGPLMSYQDGSLGMPLFLETQQGLMQMEDPLVIRHGNLGEYFSGTGEYYEANRGTGEYFAATNGLRGCSSCGQASATAPVLNLADPAVMQEVKTAMLIAPWILPYLQMSAEQIQADTVDPEWTLFTTQVANAWQQGFGPFMKEAMNAQGQTEVTQEEYAQAAQNGFVAPEQIPNALGVQSIYSVVEFMALGEDGQGKNALVTTSQFPLLTEFVLAARANDGEGEVTFVDPGFGGAFKEANMLTIGLGIAAIAGIAYLAMGKKRR